MIKNFFSRMLFVLVLLFSVQLSFGQFNINTITPNVHPLTIPQMSTGYNLFNGSDGITFVMNNTNPYPAILDTVKCFNYGSGSTTYTLWYSGTSLSGNAGGAPAAPLWTQITTSTVNVTANQLNTLFTNLNFNIPGNTRYRFQITASLNNIQYATANGTNTTPDSFANSGVGLMAGDYQIAGQNVGYGGDGLNFFPRAFEGEVGFHVLSTPCAGMPNHDTVIGNMNPCPGVLTCYGLTGNNPNSGLSYQWFESAVSATGPWTPTSLNDTNSFFCTIPPVPGPTWYMCVTTCDTSGLTDTATAIMVTPQTYSPYSPCYCGPGGPTGFTEEGIGQVVMTTIGSSLNNPAVAPPQLNNPNAADTYSNFDTLTPNLILIKGQSVNWDVLQIQLNTFMSNSWVKGFIDYNQNTSWADVGEEVFSQASTVANGNNPSGMFTVPTTAATGCTRMRIVLNEFGTATSTGPCSQFFDGETEDYVVCILDPGPYDPGVTNIQAVPSAGCLDSNGTIIITCSNYGSQILDLSINPMVIRINVQGPNGLTVYTDTINSGFLQPYATNNTFSINTGINFYTGGTYSINTDTISLIGAVNTNYINDSLFNAVIVHNSRPNAVDYNLCLNDTIPTGQGLGIINCPTAYVQDSVIIPITIGFTGNTPPAPTACAPTGAGAFGTLVLPTLPLGANMLNGEISVNNLELAPLTFTTGPNLLRMSLYDGNVTLPTTPANIYHNGAQGNALGSWAFGCFPGTPATNPSYLSVAPGIDLNQMYNNGIPVPAGGLVGVGHWSTNRCNATNILTNCGGTTVASLKIVYEYVPMGISWYEQPSGGVRISDSSLLNPLLTANSIVTNSNTAGTYTFYGACQADTNCRVEVDLVIQGITIDSVNWTNVLCNGDSSGTAYIHGSGGNTGLYYTLNGNGIIDTNTTGQFANLPAGMYALNVHDSTGCSGSDSSITIAEPTPLVIDSIVSIPPTCTPGGDGSLTVYASGGTGTMPYDSMSINGTTTIVASNQFTNLTSATYLVTVYDSNGCTDTMSHTIIVPTPPSFTNITVTNALCFGDTSGTISASATSGTSPLATYSTAPVLNQPTVGNFIGASSGPYTVTITDSLNCTADSVVNVASPPALGFASASVDSTNCNGDSTGSLTVLGTGGVLPYSYTITPDPNLSGTQTSGTFMNLPANTYMVQVSDSNGNCTHDTMLTILQPAVLGIDTASVTHVACNGDSSGVIVMTSTGGTGGVIYSTPAPGVQVPPGTITNLPANTYVINGTDANGCMASTSVQVNQASPLVIDSIVSTTPSCTPGCDAMMTVYASGGTSPYLSYGNGLTIQPAPIFTNQCAGSYTITVTDGTGCTVSSAHTISTPGAPTWNTISSTDVICFGDSNGTISTTVTGGTPPINFTIAPDPNLVGTQNNGNFSNLPSGPYVITATDTNSCSIVTNVIVGTPAILSYTSAVSDSVNCAGGSDGSITVVGAGGRMPYTYSIAPDPNTAGTQATGNFTSLPANTYVVTLSDSNNNCSLDTTLTVHEPDSLTLTATTIINVACNGDSTGSITVTPMGGTGIPTYTINPNLGTQAPLGTFTGLPMGMYTITGTDAKNCTTTTQITLTEPTPLVIDSVVSTIPSCVPGNDAIMTVYASGGTGSSPYDSMNNGILTIINNNTFTNMGGGNYTITVYDANGCSATSMHTITTPGAPTWNTIASDSVNCNGGNDGTITVTTTGGTGTVTYTSSPALAQPVTPGAFVGAMAGLHIITATDSFGCSITTNVNVGEPAILAVASAVVTDVACHGDSTGSVNVAITGGNGGNSYTISPDPNGASPQATGNFTGLPIGPYTITITDSKNCVTTTNINVQQPTPLSFTSVSFMNVSCNGAMDGSITTVGTGGTNPLAYQLNAGILQTSGSFTNLAGNIYTITLSDTNGCTLDSMVTITEPAVLNIDTASTQSILCFGDSSGSVVMTYTGGNGMPTYSISPNLGTQAPAGNFTDLPAGTYTIYGIDGNGCQDSTMVTLTQPATAVMITNITGTTPSCNPGNDGTLTITASGGTAPLRYGANLPGGVPYQSPSVLNNLPGGLYLVYVSDTNGCVDTMSYNLVNSSAPAWTSVTSTSVDCFGDSTGTITGLATGGTGAITYSITPDPNVTGNLTPGNLVAAVFNNLLAQNYQITATDANNCAVVSAISVSQSPEITFTNVVSDSVDCNGGNDGSIVVMGAGGTGTLTYGITAPSVIAPTPPATFTNLGAATYTVTITDSLNCSVDSMILVGEPALLAISAASSINIACIGDSSGSIVMSHTGGTGIPTYTINPNLGMQAPAGTFTGLPAGSYTIYGTDGNSCMDSVVINLTQPATAVQITNVTGITPSCSPGGDGIITVTAMGGTGLIDYNINSGPYLVSNSFMNLNSNTYLMGVQDVNGCTDTMTYILPASGSPTWTATTGNDVLCFGDSSGSLSLAATGGTGQITYSILSGPFAASNTTGIFTGLPANTYTVEARDTNNCLVLANVVIGQPNPLLYSNVVSVAATCNGACDGSITVTGTGGTTPYTYSSTPAAAQLPAGTFTSLCANTYAITMTDSNGCTTDTNVIVTEPTPVVIDTASSIDVLCNGDSTGSILVESSGGTGPIYHVIGTDTNQNNPANFANYPAGMYTITAIDGNGCTSTSQITINEPTPLTHSISSTDVLCFGDTTGTITMTGSGGTPSTTPPPYTYSIIPSTGSQATPGNFSGLGAGTYTGVVIDANGCRDTTAVDTIFQPTQIVFSAPVIQNIDCYGASTGSIGIAATGGTGLKTITLTGPVNPVPQVSPANFQNLPAGTYTLTATDSNSCSITTIITLTQNPQLYFSSITNTEEICFGDSNAVITFQGAGGVGPYNYVFNVGNPPGSPTPSTQTSYGGLTTNIYNIEIIDALGCRYDSNYQILGPERINFPVFIVTPTTCLDTEDGKLTVEAAGGRGGRYTYSLEPGFYVNTNGLFRDLPPRQYTLRTMDTAGCFIDTTFDVNLPSNPLVVSLTKEDLGCHGRGNEGKAEAIATGGTPPYTYLWSSTPVQTTAVVAGLYQGFHTVDVVDANGCLVRDTLVIEPGPCCQEVFLPNAFSPNGDGRNDEFRILSTAGIELQQFEVRNRWGERIWQSNNVRSSWDGTVDGEPVDLGTYYYVMRYKCLTDGQNYTKKGDVVVVR